MGTDQCKGITIPRRVTVYSEIPATPLTFPSCYGSPAGTELQHTSVTLRGSIPVRVIVVLSGSILAVHFHIVFWLLGWSSGLPDCGGRTRQVRPHVGRYGNRRLTGPCMRSRSRVTAFRIHANPYEIRLHHSLPWHTESVLKLEVVKGKGQRRMHFR